MALTKLLYQAPASTVIVVRLEQSILELSRGVNYSDNPGGASGNDGYNDYNDL